MEKIGSFKAFVFVFSWKMYVLWYSTTRLNSKGKLSLSGMKSTLFFFTALPAKLHSKLVWF